MGLSWGEKEMKEVQILPPSPPSHPKTAALRVDGACALWGAAPSRVMPSTVPAASGPLYQPPI